MSPEAKHRRREYMREYLSRTEVKARQKAHRDAWRKQNPERHYAYGATPLAKARRAVKYHQSRLRDDMPTSERIERLMQIDFYEQEVERLS